ncbi:trimeric intracellular cation channel family protein [Actinomadura sp. BRA 177]|uniref:trimeric intracellular cation channel family protein n=1 Tax=Actinomadura sp. BRA 177 TaxID=2745202 RepID=UPI0015963873|nr:TRIC cation channel family protein [Actinomadura sp. BRA 177]NVI87424.1 TRIC cation channel family protein [Actinomadura sp. BRA 177]
MSTEPPLLLALDLTGTFAFGLNGALTAVRAARLDVVGVVSLGMITALGGGVIRDVLIGAVPPATFVDWRYFALAAGGALLAYAFSRLLDRLDMPITVLDAVGLSTFAVIGASKALDHGLGVGPALLLGVVTGVGGGTMRDTLILRIPSVLRSELYAIPALVAAGITVAAVKAGLYALPSVLVAVAACFVIRMLGVRYRLNAPGPLGRRPGDGSSGSDPGDQR